MFWPLIGGFIAVFVLTLVIGWVTGRGDKGADERH
jgi:hypothetical protein